MTDSVKVSLCILWEDELRAAAKLLRALEDASDDDYPRMAANVLQACATALWGVGDDTCLLMLGAKSLREFQQRASDTSEAAP